VVEEASGETVVTEEDSAVLVSVVVEEDEDSAGQTSNRTALTSCERVMRSSKYNNFC
jgi:hypothetical protein